MKSAEALARFEEQIKRRQLARSTKEQYLHWGRRFLEFAAGRKSDGVEAVITEFLSSLTPCSVANQRGALAAIAGKNGLYSCLGGEVGKLPEWVKASRPQRVPVWVTQSEAEAIMGQLSEPWNLLAGLMFGSGLRIGEAISLRWRCFDFERGTVSVRSGKGDKCRITPLSRRLVEPLMARRERCRALWEEDRAGKRPGVAPVEALRKKFPSHGQEWPFFWVFPAAGESVDPESGIRRRHHVHEKSLARPLRVAVRRAKLDKRVTAHAFRHGFATAYLLAGGNVRELQERLGHSSIETTMGYLHCLPQDFDRIGSPLDAQGPTILPFRRTA